MSYFILILVIHFLADFGLQTHEQATLKGTSNKFLFYHITVYTLVWGVVYLTLPVEQSFIEWFFFCLLIGIPHYIVDWCTSRIGKPFWENKDLHNGFVVVGADQIAHYLCLIYVFNVLGLI